MSNLSIQFPRHDANPLAVLSLNKVDLPAAIADGNVRIELKARAVNPADLLFVQIASGAGPQTGGSEGAGVIVAVGKGVQNVKVGDRVYVNTSMPRTRNWAQFVDAPAATVVPLPPQVSFSSAAQLLVNPLTAIGFLETMQADGLKDGDFFVLTAGNSALCKMVLQLAKLRGIPYRAICIVRSSSVKDELLALGAHAVIAQDQTPDVVAAVRAIAPAGVRATFDALGGGAVAASLFDVLAQQSRHYTYGLLTPEPYTLSASSIGDMLFRGSGVQGWYLGHWLAKNYQRMGALFGEVLSHLASGKLVFSCKEFDFETQWKEAIQYTIDGSKQGKTILVSK